MKPLVETCHWQCRLRQPDKALDEDLVRQAYEVFRYAFGFEPVHGIESVRHRLLNATVLGLLRDATGAVQGFACYSVPDMPLAGAHFLWGDGMAIAPAVQGRGLSLGVVERACALFPGRAFGWMGGRSQNPIVFQRYARFGKTFPFDATYAEGEGRFVLNFLRQHIAEVRESDDVDPISGLCPRAYRWSYAADYLSRAAGADRIEAQLRRFGFDRSRGDAVIVTTKLTMPICVP
jgi:hypothetical protein